MCISVQALKQLPFKAWSSPLSWNSPHKRKNNICDEEKPDV